MKLTFSAIVNLDNGKQIEIPRFTEIKQGSTTLYDGVLENNNIIEYCRITQQYSEQTRVSVFDVSIRLVTSTCRFSYGLASERGIVINMDMDEQISNILANHHFNFWWTQPAFLTSIDQIPEQTVSVCMKRVDNAADCIYVLPVCGTTSRTQAEGTMGNAISFVMSNYTKGVSTLSDFAFALGEHEQIHAAIQATFETAALHHPIRPLLRAKRRYPEVFDRLGWCSWDAFYTSVNADGILAKADEFLEKKIPVKWMLIDDGWLCVQNDALTSFQEDPEKFPDGFPQLIETLHKDKNINDIGVWHTLAGHWGGIGPTSSLALEQQQFLIRNARNQLLPHYQAEIGFGFWNHWYQKLHNDGISFVKVDGQSAVQNHYKDVSPSGIGEIAYGIHRALEGAVASYFHGNMINCMGLSTENLWSRTGTSVVRSSDDFFPDSREGFGKHTLQNVYNSLYQGQLYYCDWDMYWTDHFDAQRHSLLRAVSGGPIYFSDKIGKTRLEEIKPLVYLDGTITRCDEVGVPTEQNIWQDPTKSGVLKVINRVKENGVMALFNLTPNEQEFQVDQKDWMLSDDDYIIYDYFKRSIHTQKTLPYSLDGFQVALLSLLPRRKWITPFGLVNKYISAHSIGQVQEFPACCSVELKESGTFGFFAETMPKEVFCGSEEVTDLMMEKDGYYVLDLPEANGTIHLMFRF